MAWLDISSNYPHSRLLETVLKYIKESLHRIPHHINGKYILDVTFFFSLSRAKLNFKVVGNFRWPWRKNPFRNTDPQLNSFQLFVPRIVPLRIQYPNKFVEWSNEKKKKNYDELLIHSIIFYLNDPICYVYMSIVERNACAECSGWASNIRSCQFSSEQRKQPFSKQLKRRKKYQVLTTSCCLCQRLPFHGPLFIAHRRFLRKWLY